MHLAAMRRWTIALGIVSLASVARAEDAGVTVQAPREVLVERRDAPSAPWTHVCASPCSFAPRGGEYRVIGVDVSPSAPFTLSGPGALKVDAGVAPLARRGLAIMTAGAGALALGLVFLFGSSAFSDPTPAGQLREEKVGMLVTGTIFGFLGLGAGAYGGAMYWDNHASRVSGPVTDVRPRGVGFSVPLSFAF